VHIMKLRAEESGIGTSKRTHTHTHSHTHTQTHMAPAQAKGHIHTHTHTLTHTYTNTTHCGPAHRVAAGGRSERLANACLSTLFVELTLLTLLTLPPSLETCEYEFPRTEPVPLFFWLCFFSETTRAFRNSWCANLFFE